MMHKVKDVVSKFFNPSFLFAANKDTDRQKRKRSISIENNTDEKQTNATTNILTNRQATMSTYVHQTPRSNDLQLIDDEDNDSRLLTSTDHDSRDIEQQKKRCRTNNYQPLFTTNIHQTNERMSSYSNRARSSSNHRLDQTQPCEQYYTERINRSSSVCNDSTSNYDPSKSILFTANTRKANETVITTNPQSNEFSANHVLATSLIDESYLSRKKRAQATATLTNNNRLLCNERQVLRVIDTSIGSHRLPYIERLRCRALQDSIRLDRTLDNEPLSVSTRDRHKLETSSSELERPKTQVKECGIQCDISIVENLSESNKKAQHVSPPADIGYEALSVSIKNKIEASTQTDLLIEKVTVSIPNMDNMKHTVLGDVTPLSWPKFARAQEAYAKKYPEKCINSIPAKSVNPSTNETTHRIENSAVVQQLNNISTSQSKTQSVWKCSTCSCEHPAQTSSCSFCCTINSNYKKVNTLASTITLEKESTSSRQISDAIVKEPSTFNPMTTLSNQTNTDTNNTAISIANTTSASNTSSSSFDTMFKTTTKENPIVSASSTNFKTFFSTQPVAMNSVTHSPIITVSSDINRPQFGRIFMTSPTPLIKENIASTSTLPAFRIATTTTEIPSIVGTTPILSTTTLDKPMNFGTIGQFKFGTSSETFPSLSMTNLATVVTTSSTPSIPTSTPSWPISQTSSPISLPFGLLNSNLNAVTPTTHAPILLQRPAIFTTTAVSSTVVPDLPTPDPISMSRSNSPTLQESTIAPSTTTTSLSFGTGGFPFSFMKNPSSSTFGIAPAITTTPSNSFALPATTISTSMNHSSPLFGTSPISSGMPFNTFLSSNTIATHIQTAGPSVISTAGFPSLTQVPSFGIGPSAVSSSGFNSGGSPSIFSLNNNQFSSLESSSSIDNSQNPFDMISDGSNVNLRPKLKARRRC